jgi:S-adenosylmethionine synthetase
LHSNNEQHLERPARHLFSSESVSEGHPDKVADHLSDAILDLYLARDPLARVACEVMVTHNFVCVAGEVRSLVTIDREAIIPAVREAIRAIGYDGFDPRFAADTVEVDVRLQPQSPEIAEAVDQARPQDQGAGDQGLMFGYASNELVEYDDHSLMPAAITFAHSIMRGLAARRHARHVPWLRPDAKSQVTIRYENGRPIGIEQIVVSTQHASDVSQSTIRDYLVEEVLPSVLPPALWTSALADKALINPSGSFIEGGAATDTGLTGRKIIVDTYGGAARHGGGAFSGKDPSKVDRSAAYAARWVAKSVVAAGLAQRCEVQLAYAIGVAQPVSILVQSFGTGCIPDSEIEALVGASFDLTPYGIIEALQLSRPIYTPTAAYGHFGRCPEESGAFSWEKTADALKRPKK